MRDTFNKILQDLHIEHFEVSPKKIKRSTYMEGIPCSWNGRQYC